MPSSWKKPGGFTLIEMMIVVLIIGILAALAVPRFFATSVRAKQSEAKQILKQFYTEQRAYRQLHDTYVVPGPGVWADAANPDVFSAISVQIMTTARYRFSVSSSDGGVSDFLATAEAPNPGLDDDPTPDVMTINHDGVIVVLSDDADD